MLPPNPSTPQPCLTPALAPAPLVGLDASDIALRAMRIASEMCIHTNSNFVTEVIEAGSKAAAEAPAAPKP